MIKPIEKKIGDIVTPSLEGMGYALVRVQLQDGSGSARVQIMAERSDGTSVTLEDCEKISRTVSALLDVSDPLPDAYRLEVSSTGIDRPLVKLEDFSRFAGNVAKVALMAPVDGRKRFQGLLLGLDGEQVKLRMEEGVEVLLPYDQIDQAKLVLTDELIAQSLREQELRSKKVN